MLFAHCSTFIFLVTVFIPLAALLSTASNILAPSKPIPIPQAREPWFKKQTSKQIQSLGYCILKQFAESELECQKDLIVLLGINYNLIKDTDYLLSIIARLKNTEQEIIDSIVSWHNACNNLLQFANKIQGDGCILENSELEIYRCRKKDLKFIIETFLKTSKKPALQNSPRDTF